MDYIMKTVGLRKAYKGNVVVDDVNIHIPKGAIYGFVGPNGAGKSTVMKMILNLIHPDAGEVQLFGRKVTDHSYEIFKRVGSIIENPYFYDKMTARQNLELHCEYMGFHNKERIDEVLHLVDLQNVEGKQVRHYSLGMKQRLAIARAILVRPEFLILDEPTAGLDPNERIRFRNLISEFSEDRLVLLSTHIVSDVEYIAHDIWLMNEGKIVRQGTPKQITESMKQRVWEFCADRKEISRLAAKYKISNIKTENQRVQVRLLAGEKPAEGAREVTPSLEDAFLYYFGEEAGEMHGLL